MLRASDTKSHSFIMLRLMSPVGKSTSAFLRLAMMPWVRGQLSEQHVHSTSTAHAVLMQGSLPRMSTSEVRSSDGSMNWKIFADVSKNSRSTPSNSSTPGFSTCQVH